MSKIEEMTMTDVKIELKMLERVRGSLGGLRGNYAVKESALLARQEELSKKGKVKAAKPENKIEAKGRWIESIDADTFLVKTRDVWIHGNKRVKSICINGVTFGPKGIQQLKSFIESLEGAK